MKDLKQSVSLFLGIRGRPATGSELDRFKVELKQPKKIIAFERELELMRFKAFGKSPEELAEFFEEVEKGEPGTDVKSKEMLERKKEAFVPDCTKESIFKYSAMIGKEIKPQMDLYNLLKAKGPYYGGQNPCLCQISFFMSCFSCSVWELKNENPSLQLS